MSETRLGLPTAEERVASEQAFRSPPEAEQLDLVDDTGGRVRRDPPGGDLDLRPAFAPVVHERQMEHPVLDGDVLLRRKADSRHSPPHPTEDRAQLGRPPG